MGRELRRKQAKREGKNVREVQKSVKEKGISPKTFVIIMTVLLLFFVILYLLTGIFITKEIKWFSKDNDDSVIEIENKILAVDSLSQGIGEYYVYFYDTTNEDYEVSNAIGLPIEELYRVDLSDEFNSNFIGEPSGIVDDINSLKVSDPTVIKVSANKIIEFYNGAEEIKNAFN